MAMQSVVLVVTCLSFASHAQRVHVTGALAQYAPDDDHLQPLSIGQSQTKQQSAWPRASQTFALLLLATSPVSAWRCTGGALHRHGPCFSHHSSAFCRGGVSVQMDTNSNPMLSRRDLAVTATSLLAGASFPLAQGTAATAAVTEAAGATATSAGQLLTRTIGEPVISGGQFPLTVGFGTCLIAPRETQSCVKQALDAGYRLIDTAQRYGNEEGVGKALKAAFSSGLKRTDVFVTTKIWIDNMGFNEAVDSVRESATKLGNLEGGIDQVLIHWPGDFIKRGDPQGELKNKLLRRNTWKALEALQQNGLVKQIGVANFGERHLKELLGYAKIKPVCNQFEVHPYNQRNDLIKLCKAEGIAVTSYSPLGGKGNQGQVTDQLLSDPVLTGIGAAHGKTAAAVILRWHLQRGLTPIPKSVTKARVLENYNVFDFELTEKEMQAIASLEKAQFAVFDGDRLA